MSEESHNNADQTPGNALQATDSAPLFTDHEESDEDELKGLTPDQFRSVLEQINALGLSWSADIPPRVRPKSADKRGILISEEYTTIQRQYPSFPRELGLVVFYALTGSEMAAAFSGEQKAHLEEKTAAVRELVITPEYKAEFFFKYAIKVPYLIDVDWEIVIKAFERNVRDMPRIPYALLSLVFRQPTDSSLPVSFDTADRDTLTVAVNEHLIDMLLGILKDVKSRLQSAQEIATSIGERDSKHE